MHFARRIGRGRMWDMFLDIFHRSENWDKVFQISSSTKTCKYFIRLFSAEHPDWCDCKQMCHIDKNWAFINNFVFVFIGVSVPVVCSDFVPCPNSFAHFLPNFAPLLTDLDLLSLILMFGKCAYVCIQIIGTPGHYSSAWMSNNKPFPIFMVLIKNVLSEYSAAGCSRMGAGAAASLSLHL